ncbi:hypothetical protein M8494_08425 [Serratia ureilytica]
MEIHLFTGIGSIVGEVIANVAVIETKAVHAQEVKIGGACYAIGKTFDPAADKGQRIATIACRERSRKRHAIDK